MERRINEMSSKRMTLIGNERQKLWKIRPVEVAPAPAPALDWSLTRAFLIISSGEAKTQSGEQRRVCLPLADIKTGLVTHLS